MKNPSRISFILFIGLFVLLGGCSNRKECVPVCRHYTDGRFTNYYGCTPPKNFSGQFIVVRGDDKSIVLEQQYQNGKLDGLSTWKDRNNVIIAQCIYRNGEPWLGSQPNEPFLENGFLESFYYNGKEVRSIKIETKDQILIEGQYGNIADNNSDLVHNIEQP